jgi:thiamine pyrophosphokinase
MSSHHIIRDEQEPALILADLDAFPFDLLGQLLEWAPYTVCGDKALDQALAYGINLDVIYSSRPNLNELVGHFPSIQTLDSGNNWIDESVRLLGERGHKAVNIVTTDCLEHHHMHRLSEQILMDVITPELKFILVNNTFSKWMPVGSSLKNVENKVLMINGVAFQGPTFSVKKEGTITVSSDHAPFIIGLSL